MVYHRIILRSKSKLRQGYLNKKLDTDNYCLRRNCERFPEPHCHISKLQDKSNKGEHLMETVAVRAWSRHITKAWLWLLLPVVGVFTGKFTFATYLRSLSLPMFHSNYVRQVSAHTCVCVLSVYVVTPHPSFFELDKQRNNLPISIYHHCRLIYLNGPVVVLHTEEILHVGDMVLLD